MASSFREGFLPRPGKPDAKRNPRRLRLPCQHSCGTACHIPSECRSIQPRRGMPSRKAHPMRIPAVVPILLTSNYSDSDPFRSENNSEPESIHKTRRAVRRISGTFLIDRTFLRLPRPRSRSCWQAWTTGRSGVDRPSTHA